MLIPEWLLQKPHTILWYRKAVAETILRMKFHSEKRLAHIMVADTGCGIANGDLPKIFDPFFSTKEEGKGLGLGLSVAYGIIARHKGVIKAESELDKGTVLTIKLPVKAKGA